nr:CRISPR-associated endonuclease Cas2 [Corynebacterium caspium]
MFDLPVKTVTQRRSATSFRKHLLKLGFFMTQLSVYVKYLPATGRSVSLVKSIKQALPTGGVVQILSITDKQWSKSIRFIQKTEVKTEEAPTQLAIF